MSLSNGLLNARSYLTILLGFLLGFAIVVWVERQMPSRIESSEGITLSQQFPPLPDSRPLTFDEAVWGRVAWQYFVNNLQANGLVNSEDNQPWTSLWSTGSYLLATVSAHQLHIIDDNEFQARISSTLATLGQLPLTPEGLPASWYRSDTLTIIGKPQSSAIGASRLLMALQVLVWRYPQQATGVQQLLTRWQSASWFAGNANSRASLPLQRWTLNADEPHNGYGYRLYASHTLRLIDARAALAISQPPDGQKMMDIDGVMVPDEGLRTPWGKQPALMSLPYLLSGLELGFDAHSGEIAWRIMQIQQRRHRLPVRKPPVSTDYCEPAPDYRHDLPNRQPVNEPPLNQAIPEQRALSSTRTAFAWYALFRNGWSESLRQQTLALRVAGRGWQRGLNPDGSVSPVIDADTNAIVLESLNYIAHGPLLCLACLWSPPSSTPDTDPAGATS